MLFKLKIITGFCDIVSKINQIKRIYHFGCITYIFQSEVVLLYSLRRPLEELHEEVSCLGRHLLVEVVEVVPHVQHIVAGLLLIITKERGHAT